LKKTKTKTKTKTKNLSQPKGTEGDMMTDIIYSDEILG
jgi:hypothetical protein